MLIQEVHSLSKLQILIRDELIKLLYELIKAKYASSFSSKYKYNFEIRILLWKLPIAIGGLDKHHNLLSNKLIKWIENSILNKQL